MGEADRLDKEANALENQANSPSNPKNSGNDKKNDTPKTAGNGKGGTADQQYDGLTEREREILCLVATDHTNSEIADVLHLSKQTVHNIRARLMEKLGFHDRLQLVKYAIRRRIVGLEEV